MKDTMMFRLRRWRHRMKLGLHWRLRPRSAFRPFFILASYRSGSNLLIDFLRSQGQVQCLGEVLLPTISIGLSRAEYSRTRALTHIARSLHSLKKPVRGCKLMLDQLASCDLTVDDLRQAFPTAKYLILFRESLVDQFLSQRSGHATSQWIVRQHETPKQARIAVDPEMLVEYCRQLRGHYEELLTHSWLRERSSLFSYEQLVADPAAILNEQIGPLLGIPTVEPTTKLRKQNTLPMDERVENYAEVRELLTSPEFEQHYAWPAASPQYRKAS